MADIYRVENIETIEDLVSGGRFVTSRRITFTTIPYGDQGSVTIPVAQALPEVVDATIRQEAQHMITIREM